MATACLASNGYRIAKAWQQDDPLPATPFKDASSVVTAAPCVDFGSSSGSEDKPLLLLNKTSRKALRLVKFFGLQCLRLNMNLVFKNDH